MGLRKAPPLEPVKSLGTAYPNADAWLTPREDSKAILNGIYNDYHKQLIRCVNVKSPLAEEIDMLRYCTIYANALIETQKLRVRHERRDGDAIMPNDAESNPFKALQNHALTLRNALERASDAEAKLPQDAFADTEFETSKQQFMNECLIMGGVLADARLKLKEFQEKHANKLSDAHSVTVAKYLHGLYGTALDYVAHIQDRFTMPTIITSTSEPQTDTPKNLVTRDRLMDARWKRQPDYKGSEAEQRALDWKR